MFAPFTVQTKAEKSGLPTMAAISGVTTVVTNEVTTAANAAPMTTATARSITLPSKMNCLKPDSIRSESSSGGNCSVPSDSLANTELLEQRLVGREREAAGADPEP